MHSIIYCINAISSVDILYTSTHFLLKFVSKYSLLIHFQQVGIYLICLYIFVDDHNIYVTLLSIYYEMKIVDN